MRGEAERRRGERRETENMQTWRKLFDDSSCDLVSGARFRASLLWRWCGGVLCDDSVQNLKPKEAVMRLYSVEDLPYLRHKNMLNDCLCDNQRVCPDIIKVL